MRLLMYASYKWWQGEKKEKYWYLQFISIFHLFQQGQLFKGKSYLLITLVGQPNN
jgi:hypothetical protein